MQSSMSIDDDGGSGISPLRRIKAVAASRPPRRNPPLTMILGSSRPGRTATWNSARTPAVLTGMARTKTNAHGSEVSSGGFSYPCCRTGAETFAGARHDSTHRLLCDSPLCDKSTRLSLALHVTQETRCYGLPGGRAGRGLWPHRDRGAWTHQALAQTRVCTSKMQSRGEAYSIWLRYSDIAIVIRAPGGLTISP